MIILRVFILSFFFPFNMPFFCALFLALVSVECVWTHIYVGGEVLQAHSSYAFTHSLLSISGFVCSHSLLLFFLFHSLLWFCYSFELELAYTLKKKVFYRTPKKGSGDLEKRPNVFKCLKNGSSDLRNL
jgi:hypothetical protein